MTKAITLTASNLHWNKYFQIPPSPLFTFTFLVFIVLYWSIIFLISSLIRDLQSNFYFKNKERKNSIVINFFIYLLRFQKMTILVLVAQNHGRFEIKQESPSIYFICWILINTCFATFASTRTIPPYYLPPNHVPCAT